jgi:hydrogenase maturation protease
VSARVLVVGLGNVLAGDDGLGPETVAILRSEKLPEECRVEEAGCDGLVLAGLWKGEPEVWLVDSVARGAPAGTVHRLDHDEILGLPQTHAGAHQLSLPETLRCLRLAFPHMAHVRYRLWGVEPGRVGPPAGMTPRVSAAARLVAGEIRRALPAGIRGSSAAC